MLQIISAQRRFRCLLVTAGVLISAGSGCGRAPTPAPDAPATTIEAPSRSEPAIRIVVLGDSLAAGLGLAESEAFPSVVESLLRDEGFDVGVVNAGVSGDTTAGGLSRLDWVLQQPTRILVVELGGNDALRGQPLANTEKNLREIVRLGREAGAEVVLLGMDVPVNYGPDYAGAFAELYPRVAEEEGAVLVPGFVRDLGADPTLLQPDGLHPTAEGQRRLAERLLPTLTGVVEGLEPGAAVGQ
jgi:acyl-CoA thioesterase-1